MVDVWKRWTAMDAPPVKLKHPSLNVEVERRRRGLQVLNVHSTAYHKRRPLRSGISIRDRGNMLSKRVVPIFIFCLASGHGVNISICPTNKEWFCVDGKPTHSSAPSVTGLLLNSRMIQGVFDDANVTTRQLWKYPDGSPYDADRQASELAGNLSAYVSCGLDAFTVGMQGGGPLPTFPVDQPNESSGFFPDGTPDPKYLARLEVVLQAAALARIVPIVSLFYQGQIDRIDGDAAVTVGVDAMVDWLVAGGYAGSVILEIANEVGYSDFPPSLQPDTVHSLISHAISRSNGTLMVSTSFLGSVMPPPDSAITASAFVTTHCNGESPAEAAAHVATIKATAAWQAAPKPIIFNECGTNLTVMDAAIESRASWGYYDQGKSNYVDGFQGPPTNWNMTAAKDKNAFFARVATYAGRMASCEAASGA